MPLLEYSKWQKFVSAIDRAREAAVQSGNRADDHFTGAGKMVLTGSGAEREVVDYHLTCYAEEDAKKLARRLRAKTDEPGLVV